MNRHLQRLHSLFQLAGAVIIFVGDVQFFPLAGALSQFERLLKVLASKIRLANIQILGAHAGICHSEIRVDLDRTLVQSDRGERVASFAQLISLAERLQSLKR